MTPRHDAAAERAVLSAMMLSPDAVDDASSLLTSDDFYRPTHALVFTAITWLHEQGRRVDQVTLADVLDKRGRLAEVGGKAELIDIAGASPNISSVSHHARIVFREAVMRRLHIAGGQIAVLDADDEHEAVDTAGAMVTAAIGEGRSDAVDVTDALSRALERYENPPATVQLKEWGLWVDKGSVVIVGARPSVGKTAWMIGEAAELAERHMKCRFYSYEMSEHQIVSRLVSRKTVYDGFKLRQGLSSDELADVRNNMAGDWSRFISVNDHPGSIDRLVTDMRRFARNGGSCVFVDYLQLIGRQDTETATENSRRLKIAAGMTGLTVVAASQLSRDGKKEDGSFRKPSIGDLRQTGAIEQDADVVLLLHEYAEHDTTSRDRMRKLGYILDQDDLKALSHVEVVKARNGEGSLGERYAWFDGEDMRWSPLDRTKEGGPL